VAGEQPDQLAAREPRGAEDGGANLVGHDA
jgi:hypothetical protein